MRQYLLISLLVIVGIGLVSCGSKKMQEKVVKNISTQKTSVDAAQEVQQTADPFADLSLDDIRNNIEFLDTQKIATKGDVALPQGNLVSAEEQQARLSDIAIPFDARLLDQYADFSQQSQTVLGYVSGMSIPDVVGFYTTQMETLGWHCAGHIRGWEELLLFERPGRSCSVVLRSLVNPKHVDASLTKIVMFLRTS
jgi:hypothetical protein